MSRRHEVGGNLALGEFRGKGLLRLNSRRETCEGLVDAWTGRRHFGAHGGKGERWCMNQDTRRLWKIRTSNRLRGTTRLGQGAHQRANDSNPSNAISSWGRLPRASELF